MVGMSRKVALMRSGALVAYSVTVTCMIGLAIKTIGFRVEEEGEGA